jgi:hypothetical protein
VQQGMVKALYGTKPVDMPDMYWKEVEAKAVATIWLSLVDDVMYHIMNEKSPAAVWLKLESQYMSKSLTNKQRLYGLKMAEGLDLSQHINLFNKVISDLKRVDVKFKDEDKVLMLLNSLLASPTYKNLVTTLTWGKESLELEDVTRAMLAFHQRKKASDDSSQGEGLIMKGNEERGRSRNKGGSNGKNSRSKPRKSKDINCYKCRKKAHIKRDCPNRKKNNDDENEGSSRSVNVVEVNSDNADGDMLYVASNLEHLADSWFLDSACSFHVTSNRDWFDTYRSVNYGIVTMGNGAHCKMTSIANIGIKMFDGVVKTLCDVRHVPYVEKNMISFGTLDSNGFGYKSEGGIMKVTKGVMVVMMGSRKFKEYL